MLAADRPAPESCTAISTTSVPAAVSPLRVTLHVTLPFFLLNLMALLKRLRSTTFIWGAAEERACCTGVGE